MQWKCTGFHAALKSAGVPQMRRQVTTRQTTRGAANSVSASVLVCVALTSGALFGLAAQIALNHFGLDLMSVRDDLLVDRIAQTRSALAWWAWWLLPVAAFFVGSASVAVDRAIAAYWWLLRGPRLVISAALVLLLGAIGHLSAAPSLAFGTGAMVGGLIALLSAVLAALGAVWAHAAARKASALSGPEDGRSRSFDPVLKPQPRGGGGSVDSGIPARRARPDHSFVPSVPMLGRWAVAAAMALVVFAAAAAVSGAAVVLELLTPGSVRELLAWTAPPAPKPEAKTIVPPIRGSAGPRPRAVIPMSASEYTFAKGYATRRAARVAEEFVTAALRADIQVPAKLGGRNVAVIQVERDGQAQRTTSHERRTADNRGGQAHRPAAHGRRMNNPVAAGTKRYAAEHWHASRHRYRARDYFRAHERYTRYERRYRYAGF